MDAVEPWNYAEMTGFNMSYLAGFLADKYDVDKAGVLYRIKNRAAKSAEDVLRRDIIGYTSVSVQNERFNLIRSDWQYVLFPLWFMTYIYKGKSYQFAVNGQTGKVAGIPPMSTLKFIIMLLLCIAVPTLVGILIALFGG
jgi:hypothetical protein